ncbi:MAG: hypothetical protein WD046_09355 [Paracoccaceae bacterium]
MKQSKQKIGELTRLSVSTFSAVTILGVLAVTAASVALFSNGLALSHYKTLHFALSYEAEFLKRGLVGEAFRLLGISPWGGAPGVFTLMVLLLLSGVYALGVHALLRQRAHPVLAAILIALWASPAALPHMTADFGRFDALLILLLGVWAVCSFALTANLSLVLLTLVGCAAILTHEIALFATVPIGLALWLIRYGEPLISVRTVAFGAVISLAFVLIWTFGNGDTLTREGVTAMVSERFGTGNYSIELMLLVLFGDISENAAYSAREAARFAPLREHLEFLGIMSGFLLLLGSMVAIAVRRLPRHGRVAVMACLTPLALYPLGYDYFRWLSFVLINMTVLSIWVMLHDPGTTDAIIARCRDFHRAIQGLSFLFLVVGPLGIFTCIAIREAPLFALILR